MIPLWMFPLAIACGNSFILKPSEKDPSTAVRLVEIAEKAGVPSGLINVVHGNKETVDYLINHPEIKVISFVGSSAVAEHVFHTATQQNKRVQAFGGAKNHCVVMPDADLDQAADAITNAAYGCAGERCMAISVVLVIGDKTANVLVDALKKRAEKLKIGPGADAQTQIGPLNYGRTLATCAELCRVRNTRRC